MGNIKFVVKCISEGDSGLVFFDGYKEAFEYFSEKESEGRSPILFREVTEVARQVLLRAGASA